MKKYNAGQLRDKCKIVELKTTTDAYGFAEEKYILKYSLKCFIEPMDVSRSVTADRNVSTLKTTVVIRRKDDITTRDYILMGEEVFRIINVVREVGGQYMEIVVERVE